MTDDVLRDAANWYMDTLAAVEGALVELKMRREDAEGFAPLFVAALARQGFTIEPEEI